MYEFVGLNFIMNHIRSFLFLYHLKCKLVASGQVDKFNKDKEQYLMMGMVAELFIFYNVLVQRLPFQVESNRIMHRTMLT